MKTLIEAEAKAKEFTNSLSQLRRSNGAAFPYWFDVTDAFLTSAKLLLPETERLEKENEELKKTDPWVKSEFDKYTKLGFVSRWGDGGIFEKDLIILATPLNEKVNRDYVIISKHRTVVFKDVQSYYS